MVIFSGIVVLSRWVFFWAVLIFDLYLTHPGLNMIARFIVIAAIVMNVPGLILEAITYKKKKWPNAAGGMALHLIPVIVFGCFRYWFAFGHWM